MKRRLGGLDPISGLIVGQMRLRYAEGGEGSGSGSTSTGSGDAGAAAGAGTADAAAGGAGTGTGTPPEGDTDAATKAQQDAAAKVDVNGDDFKALPAWAQKQINDLRKEAGDRRIENKTAVETATRTAKEAAYKDIGKALGLVEDDKVDADKVSSELADSQRELAVYRAASADVKVQALLDSRSFLSSIKDIDPSDAAGIKAAIATAVENNPTFKTTPVVAKSGGDLGGGSGEGNKSKPTTLAGALDQHYAKK